MATALGDFAQGLVGGYIKAKKDQQEQQLRDIQIQKAKEDEALGGEIKKAATTKAKVDPGFVVTTTDGQQNVFADKKTAEDAVKAAGDGAQLTNVFLVGGKPFTSKDSAEFQVMQDNSPAGKARQFAQIATAANRPKLAAAYVASYQSLAKANRDDKVNTLLDMKGRGDYNGILNGVNTDLAHLGRTAKLTPNADGTATFEVVDSSGKPVAPPQNFATPNDWVDSMITQASKTADNWNEISFHEKSLALQQKRADADIAHQKVMEGNSSAQLGLAQQRLNADMDLKNRPIVEHTTGLMPDGTLGVVQVTRQWNPTTKQYDTTYGQPVATGLMPNRAANPFADLAGMVGKGGTGGTSLTPAQIMQSGATLGPNKAVPPAATPTPAAPSAPAQPKSPTPASWGWVPPAGSQAGMITSPREQQRQAFQDSRPSTGLPSGQQVIDAAHGLTNTLGIALPAAPAPTGNGLGIIDPTTGRQSTWGN